MNLLYFLILLFGGLFASPNGNVMTKSQYPGQIDPGTKTETRNIHRFNPKTVVALEDTHFKPNE